MVMIPNLRKSTLEALFSVKQLIVIEIIVFRLEQDVEFAVDRDHGKHNLQKRVLNINDQCCYYLPPIMLDVILICRM